MAAAASSTIGIIVTDLDNAFFADVSTAAARVARRAGFAALVACSEDDEGWERALVEQFEQVGVAGLILAPAGPDFGHLLHLQQRGFPFVLMDRMVQDLDCDCVVVENQDSSRQLCDTLLCHGARRVAFLGGPVQTWTGRERLEGYRAALRSWRIRFDNALVQLNDFTPEGGQRGAERILKVQPTPDALFCANNRILWGALRAMAEAPRVPWAHLPIACFDEVPLMDQLGRPLVVAAQPEEELGARAAEMLLARIRSAPAGAPRMGKPYRREQLPVRLKRYGF